MVSATGHTEGNFTEALNDVMLWVDIVSQNFNLGGVMT